MPVPKTLHFVWVGTKPLPMHRADKIKDWINCNPDFNVILWIDSQTLSRQDINNYSQQKRYFAEHAGNDVGQIQIIDINDDYDNVVSPEVRYEIDRMRPNFGSASDLIRYNVLYHYGGVYIDSDVSPPNKGDGSLSVNCDIWHESGNYLYLAQYEHETANDYLACPPGNPAIGAMKYWAHSNYSVLMQSHEINQLLDQVQLPQNLKIPFYQVEANVAQQVYLADRPNVIKMSTIDKTGPSLLSFVKRQHQQDIAYIEENNLRLPLNIESSYAAWLNRGTYKHTTLEKALQRVKTEIQYELDHVNVLRMDDHLTCLLESLQLQSISQDTIIQAYLDTVNEFNFNQVKHVQLSLVYPETVLFAKQHNLLAQTYLLPNNNEELQDTKVILNSAVQPFVHTDPLFMEGYEAFGSLNFKIASVYFYQTMVKELYDNSQLSQEKTKMIQECINEVSDQLKESQLTLDHAAERISKALNELSQRTLNAELIRRGLEVIRQNLIIEYSQTVTQISHIERSLENRENNRADEFISAKNLNEVEKHLNWGAQQINEMKQTIQQPYQNIKDLTQWLSKYTDITESNFFFRFFKPSLEAPSVDKSIYPEVSYLNNLGKRE